MGAWKTYQSLNSEQKQILSRKQLEINRPMDGILDLLKPIAACDGIANKAQTRFGCTFGLGIVLTIVLAIVFTNIGWSAVTGGAIVVAIAIVIAAGWGWFWLRSIDVSDNLRSFVVPVFALFREDIDPKHPVHLRLDIDNPVAARKKTFESPAYAEGQYYKIIDTSYLDPWMTAEAVLVDGTKLSWSVTDRIRERKKTKRNPRGKIKTKTKYTKKTDVEVSLALRTKTFAPADGEVSRDGKRSKVEVERSVRSESLDAIDPRALIDAITEVYRSARVVKKEAGA
jgi:hypothetical protein